MPEILIINFPKGASRTGSVRKIRELENSENLEISKYCWFIQLCQSFKLWQSVYL